MRVVAATWRDLATAVERGSFRQDLFYRLNVVSIPVLPLRERRDEIPALIEHFVHCFAPGDTNCFSGEALMALYSYDWPGNVRQLRNVIQRVCALAENRLFGVRDLPVEMVTARETALPRWQVGIGDTIAGIGDTIVSLGEMEKAHILGALKLNDGDRGKTASQLGIDRATLYRKLKSYDSRLLDE